MGKITFAVEASLPSEWYGTLMVSNIQLDGKPLKVNKLLVVSFKVPTKNFAAVDAWGDLGPPPVSDIDTKQIDDLTIQVTVYLRFSSPFAFDPGNTLTFGVTGDMSDPRTVEESITLTKDPSGTDLTHFRHQVQKKAI